MGRLRPDLPAADGGPVVAINVVAVVGGSGSGGGGGWRMGADHRREGCFAPFRGGYEVLIDALHEPHGGTRLSRGVEQFMDVEVRIPIAVRIGVEEAGVAGAPEERLGAKLNPAATARGGLLG